MGSDIGSSSSCITQDIFISCKEEDTGWNYADHLNTALREAGFQTFMDLTTIPVGHQIEPEVDRAIAHSTMAIVVFTINYGSSEGCLNALLKILQRQKFDDRYPVIPIFYHLEPRIVGNQKNSFQAAFNEHERNGKHSKETIDQWRAALKEVSKFSGLPKTPKHGYEAEHIKEIVKYVGTILQQKVSDDDACLVGIGSRVRGIDVWLKDTAGVGVVVVTGMKGVGKTTVVEIAYYRNVANYKASSYLRNIKEASKQENGLSCLRNQLIADISNGIMQNIDDIEEGNREIEDVKSCLVILDDVDQIEQFNFLINPTDWFFKFCKIIITTSRVRLLTQENQNHKTFSINKLDYHESLQLFSLHAFSLDRPRKGYSKLSTRVIEYCEGLPFQLRVIGSSLSGKKLEHWKEVLEKLEDTREGQTDETLEVSYKMLDEDTQQLFLEIAMLMLGQDANDAETVLKKCDFYSEVGMQNLKKKSFIKVDNQNKLMMDPSLAAMARRIINQKTVRGSIICKNEKGGKRKRSESCQDESVLPIKERPLWYKRVCPGLYTLIGTPSWLTRFFPRQCW
uniref:disease resistance protein RUN1-like n=1 Tax=Erigeron canadensis TaxID=72917 RepID=UPI001CB9AFE3|nr:disease resistance protein RUN1-like [Erigeron canadensis]